MKKIDQLKVLQEMDTLEEERKKYGPLKGGLRRCFMQDIKDPSIFTLSGSDAKFTRKKVDKFAKYSKIFVIVPASQMLKNRDKT